MLQELFAAIGQQAVNAAAPKVLKLSPEPDHVYAIEQGGSIDFREAAPRPRSHTASDLTSVVLFAKRFQDDEKPPVVWFSRSKVTCLLNDDERRDQVTLPLSLSKQIICLVKLEQTRHAYKQAELVKELRVTFHGCLGPAGNLLEVLRRLKFKSGCETDVAIGHGKQSVGKSIMGEITGAGNIPEYVSFDVPIFEGAFSVITARVQCAIEPDVATETIQLIPLPGQVEDAIRSAEQAIGEALVEKLGEDVPVYYGNP